MTDATARRPATAGPTALDRFLAAIPVAAAALAILMILVWEAAVRKTPTIFVDELKWAQLSRAIAETGRAAQRGEPASFKSLYSVLIAPCWWLSTTGAAYTAIKYVNVVVMSCAAIPVYFLARRLVSPTAATIAALGTLCTSALFYAPFLLPEVLAYPTACACAWLCVRALAGDGRRWTVAAICACVVAVAVRSQLVCVGGAFAAAAVAVWVLGPRSRRLRARWSRSDHAGAAVLGIGALILLNALIAHKSNEWAVVTQSYQGRMWHLILEACSALTIGLGLLPAIAGLASLWLPERRDDPAWRAFAAFLAASILTFGAYTGVKAAYLSVTFGTFVEERNLIYLGPLLIVGAAVYFSARRPSVVAAALASALCAWLVLAYGYQLGFPYFEAPGYGIAVMANRAFAWDQHAIRLALAAILVVAALVCALPFVRHARLTAVRPVVLGLAVLGAAVWGLAGEVTSARGSQAGARQLAANLPQPLDWVDQRTGGDGVTYLGQHVGSDIGLALTEFWNQSIKHVWTIDGTAPGPGPTLTPDLARADGTLRYDPGLDYVLAGNGVSVVGRTVQANGPLTLVRVAHPWRLREAFYGRAPDAWVADRNDATYAYFGPGRRGVLTVDVSRSGFCARSAPPTPVVVGIGPVALNSQRAPVVGHAATVRRFLLHSCQDHPIRVHTTAPVAVSLHVARLVRATDYGIGDSRELGAQFNASFAPKH
jgi:Dolichyl-phosphate-mannose-protein mannosyltransferase